MQEASNLLNLKPLATKIGFSHMCLASLSLRSAVAKPDVAYFSATQNRPPRSKRHRAWRPFNKVTREVTPG